MSREQIILGNWKMYKTAQSAVEYIEELIPQVQGCRSVVCLAVPFTVISPSVTAAKKSSILIGAQNMNDAREGAFTGEVAALMLKEAGAHFVLIGHSERRQIFGESDEYIHRKVIRALQDDLRPVLCVGETLDEYESEKTEEVLQRQIEIATRDIPKEFVHQLIIAYEPIWAIGTGKTSTPEHSQKIHIFLRNCLAKIFGKRKADQISILYGGSVKPGNVKNIISQKDIDGVLVGGASLEAQTFAQIVQHCEGIA